MSRLGEIVRTRRKAAKFSLSKTSEISGVAKGYLHEIETSSHANPSLRVMAALARTLDLSMEDFFEILTEAEAPLPPSPAAKAGEA